MENLAKGIKNMNIIIDMINSKKRWKSRKEFCGDLIKDNIENNKDIKEPEIPVMKRINKSLIYFSKLKPAVIIK